MILGDMTSVTSDHEGIQLRAIRVGEVEEFKTRKGNNREILNTEPE